MALEQLKVWEIVRQAVGKNIDIPEFQRDFVWDPDQVKLLAESLYREYPVSSFLLWDSSEYREAAEDWNKALERYDVMVNLLPGEADRLEFALPNPIRRRDPSWVSLRRILSTEKLEMTLKTVGGTSMPGCSFAQ